MSLLEQIKTLMSDGIPRTCADMYAHESVTADEKEQVSKAIYYLRQEGVLQVCNPGEKPARYIAIQKPQEEQAAMPDQTKPVSGIMEAISKIEFAPDIEVYPDDPENLEAIAKRHEERHPIIAAYLNHLACRIRPACIRD